MENENLFLPVFISIIQHNFITDTSQASCFTCFLQNNIILQHLIQPATIYHIRWNLNESKKEEKKNLGPVGARAIELSLQHFNSTERL